MITQIEITTMLKPHDDYKIKCVHVHGVLFYLDTKQNTHEKREKKNQHKFGTNQREKIERTGRDMRKHEKNKQNEHVRPNEFMTKQ